MRLDTGRSFFMSSLLSVNFFNRGETRADWKCDGKHPSESNKLTILSDCWYKREHHRSYSDIISTRQEVLGVAHTHNHTPTCWSLVLVQRLQCQHLFGCPDILVLLCCYDMHEHQPHCHLTHVFDVFLDCCLRPQTLDILLCRAFWNHPNPNQIPVSTTIRYPWHWKNFHHFGHQCCRGKIVQTGHWIHDLLTQRPTRYQLHRRAKLAGRSSNHPD